MIIIRIFSALLILFSPVLAANLSDTVDCYEKTIGKGKSELKIKFCVKSGEASTVEQAKELIDSCSLEEFSRGMPTSFQPLTGMPAYLQALKYEFFLKVADNLTAYYEWQGINLTIVDWEWLAKPIEPSIPISFKKEAFFKEQKVREDQFEKLIGILKNQSLDSIEALFRYVPLGGGLDMEYPFPQNHTLREVLVGELQDKIIPYWNDTFRYLNIFFACEQFNRKIAEDITQKEEAYLQRQRDWDIGADAKSSKKKKNARKLKPNQKQKNQEIQLEPKNTQNIQLNPSIALKNTVSPEQPANAKKTKQIKKKNNVSVLSSLSPEERERLKREKIAAKEQEKNEQLAAQERRALKKTKKKAAKQKSDQEMQSERESNAHGEPATGAELELNIEAKVESVPKKEDNTRAESRKSTPKQKTEKKPVRSALPKGAPSSGVKRVLSTVKTVATAMASSVGKTPQKSSSQYSQLSGNNPVAFRLNRLFNQRAYKELSIYANEKRRAIQSRDEEGFRLVNHATQKEVRENLAWFRAVLERYNQTWSNVYSLAAALQQKEEMKDIDLFAPYKEVFDEAALLDANIRQVLLLAYPFGDSALLIPESSEERIALVIMANSLTYVLLDKTRELEETLIASFKEYKN